MSEQRLIDANFLAECIEGAANRLVSEYGSNSITDTLTELSNALKDGRLGITVDAVPREEYESLLKRFRHLLESDYIRSFDEVKPGTGEYKRDIREADLENQRAHWIANCTCSRCMRGIRSYAIQSGYVFCPFCGADMREVHE